VVRQQSKKRKKKKTRSLLHWWSDNKVKREKKKKKSLCIYNKIYKITSYIFLYIYRIYIYIKDVTRAAFRMKTSIAGVFFCALRVTDVEKPLPLPVACGTVPVKHMPWWDLTNGSDGKGIWRYPHRTAMGTIVCVVCLEEEFGCGVRAQNQLFLQS